jgi:integrase
MALSEGPGSALWAELRATLPDRTFLRFADLLGVKEKPPSTWVGLRKAFEAQMAQRVGLGTLRASTAKRYAIAIREFDDFLMERGILNLAGVTRSILESFRTWRIARINEKSFARGGVSVALDASILHTVFSFAVAREMVLANPIRLPRSPAAHSQRAVPFTAGELGRLRSHAGDDLLAVLLLRWTGLRASDSVRVTWGEIDFAHAEIDRVTMKKGKRVVVPIHRELLDVLTAARAQRAPQATDTILTYPGRYKKINEAQLYRRLKALGRRAGVPDCRAHRFRDTLAVDMLMRSATLFEVAKVLGNTAGVVERHYSPFVRALRERVRGLIESDGGLEGDKDSAEIEKKDSTGTVPSQT